MKRLMLIALMGCFAFLLQAQGMRPRAPRSTQATPQAVKSPPEDLAQVEIMPFGGYMFGGRMDLYNGELDIKGNANYGIALGVPTTSTSTIELSYFRMDTEAEWNPYSFFNGGRSSYDVAVQYFQAGVIKYIRTGPVRPFGSVSIGATWFENKSTADWGDQWAFSAVVGAGIRVEATEEVAFRFQGRFMVPMYFDGIGIGIGTGGVSSGAYFGAYALQGDFSAGIIFKL